MDQVSSTNLHIGAIFIIFIHLFTNAEGYCYQVDVSNALYVSYPATIDGTFDLLSTILCNDNPAWVQTENAYISIMYDGQSAPPNTATFSGPVGWIIGFTPNGVACQTGSVTILAFNEQIGASDPYSVNGLWYEYNGTSYVANPNLTVSCSDGLSGWAIFGIVIGSVFGVLLILSIIYGCCISRAKRTSPYRNRRANPRAMVYTANGTTATVVTTSPPVGQPLPGTFSTDPVYFINPPAYDSSNQPPGYDNGNPPPAYEAINPVTCDLAQPTGVDVSYR